MMIGGPDQAVRRLDPIFQTLAPGAGDIPRTPGREKIGGSAERGYLHCGPSGAGHFVKMVHNGIEYGLMAAYAEGLNILKCADVGMQSHEHDAETTPLRHPEHYQYQFDVAAISELWRRGSGVVAGSDGGGVGGEPESRGLRREGVGLGGGAVDDSGGD